MEHPLSDQKLALEYPEFIQRLEARLRKGAEEYGDGSFQREAEALCEEMEQEAIDICGWGFILWTRIQELKARIASFRSKIVKEESPQAEVSQSLPDLPSPSPSSQPSKSSGFLNLGRLRRRFGAR